GVRNAVIVRGIVGVRRGVRGGAEGIRIVSLVGRLLDHARIYACANAGGPEYFIGSADLRSRNLRRRVEVVAPVMEPSCRAHLETILDRELNDPAAWRLETDCCYRRSKSSRVAGAQSQWSFIADAQGGEVLASP